MDVADSSGTLGAPDGIFDEFDLNAIRNQLPGTRCRSNTAAST